MTVPTAIQKEHMFSGLPPKADLTDGPLFRSREQRREDRTPLFGQPLARRHLIALDQAADDQLLRTRCGGHRQLTQLAGPDVLDRRGCGAEEDARAPTL
jgi:hypothetical protein